MARRQLLKLLNKGVMDWNISRPEKPDLSGVDLSGRDLQNVNLSKANLKGANLSGALLRRANLWRCNLQGADLSSAMLFKADLAGAQLRGANLQWARMNNVNLTAASLSEADLSHADLERATLVATSLRFAVMNGANLTESTLVRAVVHKAIFTGARIYGIGVWDLRGKPSNQENLVITRKNDPPVTVDNLKVAQFIYLLLTNSEIRDVIDTITAKVVLILGRFTEQRMVVLDAIRDELRRRNLTPVLFDFDKPASKDVTGTVETLARMARFVIADLTDPSSIPHELATIVPFLRTTPVLPLRLVGSQGYGMFDDLQRAYTWVLDTYEYNDIDSLLSTLPKVIAPANKMADKLRKTP